MKNLIDYIQEGLKITADTEIDDFYDTPGVYAYFNDKTLSDDEDYINDHKKDAIGVAVIAKVEGKLHRIVVDKTDVSTNLVYYGGYDKSISGATTTRDRVTALKDIDGRKNTVAISDACHKYDDGSRTGSAAEDCQARFNGKGYLPSLGELQMLYDNKDEVDKMMNAIDGKALKKDSYWSSTLCDTSTISWYFDWDNGDTLRSGRFYDNYVRAVMEI